MQNMKVTSTKKTASHSLPENPIEFYIAEEIAGYGHKNPFTAYYDNPEHSVRLLKGNRIEILNQVRENSVDMIFADSPIFSLTEELPAMRERRSL